VKADKTSGRLLRALPLLLMCAALLLPSTAAAQQAPGCQFVLGFKSLHDLTPGDVGDCLDNQSYVDNGDAQQHTAKGLLVWRKGDNWTAFTNGYQTWINGPEGLAKRLNTDRFPWEAAAPAAPAAPASAATPAPTPIAAPTAKPVYPWYFKKVTDPPAQLCGAGQAFPCIDSAPNEGTQYVGGHVIKKDGTVATGMIVQARIVGNQNLLFSTTGDDGLFNIAFGINCPAGPFGVDVWLVDGGMVLSSYINHITYTNCKQAGEFHFDFVEVS
jgi:hypothetical protein